MVPDFNGQTELLPRFIEIYEKLVAKFYNTTNAEDFQNEYLMSSILAKIKGDAASIISSCRVSNWHELKNALINTYADKRDCYTLNIELTELRQNSNESPFDFYNRLQKILNLQISYLTTQVPRDESLILNEYFRNYALRILLRGLRDPVGSLMRTKNPRNLSAALNMLTNDFQLEINQTKPYKTNIHNNQQNKSNIKPHFNQQNRNPHYLSQQSSRPQNYVQSFRPTQNYPTTTQTNTRNIAPQNRNVFRPNTNTQNLSRPTPMSIYSKHQSKQIFSKQTPTKFHIGRII